MIPTDNDFWNTINTMKRGSVIEGHDFQEHWVDNVWVHAGVANKLREQVATSAKRGFNPVKVTIKKLMRC